ncbi:MAG: hypothetical protein ACLRWQ_01910 [Flavonifractor plautii]
MSWTPMTRRRGHRTGPSPWRSPWSAGSDGQIVWFSSSAFLEDMYNALSSGANVNLGMNALSSLVGESEAMAIRSKSLNYNYLTISESTSSLLKVLMIGVCTPGLPGRRHRRGRKEKEDAE